MENVVAPFEFGAFFPVRLTRFEKACKQTKKNPRISQKIRIF